MIDYVLTGKVSPATRTAYIKDDVVQYGGRVYALPAAPTAAASFYTDLDILVAGESTPRWELMNDGSEWKGDWIPSNFYKENDIVKYRGIIYRCIIALQVQVILH